MSTTGIYKNLSIFCFHLQVPSASVSMESGMALNHCRWHQTGLSIAAGDDVGRIYIYDVAEVHVIVNCCFSV